MNPFVDSDLRSWRSWTVAVTGINARADNPGPGCSVARCLKENAEFNGRLIGLGYDVLDAGLYNKNWLDDGYLIPYPAAGDAVLLERIEDICQAERIDAIIPCLDSELTSFIRIKPELERLGIRLLIPGRDRLLAREKSALFDLCQSIGVKTPETRLVSDQRFFDECKELDWPYPFMLKGNFYDAYAVHSPEEARAVFDRLISSWGYPTLAQKIIKGDEYNLTAIGDGRGAMLGEVMMRKRALTDKGKAWAGVTINDPELKNLAASIVEKLCWQGPFELETMRDQSGKLNVIEFNPRFPSWIYTSKGVGRNLPVLLLRLMDDPNFLPTFPSYRSGVLFIRYAEELLVEMADFESVFVRGSTDSQKTISQKSDLQKSVSMN